MAIDTSLHAELQRKAKDHLWLHFSSMGAYRDNEIPIIERGEGPYLFDTHGKRYLDMLSGSVHRADRLLVRRGARSGRARADAAAPVLHELDVRPPARGRARRPARRSRPAQHQPRVLRLRRVRGRRVGLELARQYHAANGQPMRRKVISRKVAYHGTTMGALSITGITSIRTPFEPLIDGVRHVANTNRYRCKYCAEAGECSLACADEVAETIEQEGPETVAMVIMEPVQNSGGTFTPHPDYHRRVREICDAYGVLQVADEVICGFGRLGEWFGCQRYGYEPDLITCAKGLTSGYASLGALLISDRVAEPFVEGGEYYLHGITFGGHPMATAIGSANLDVMERLDLLANVRANEVYFAEQLHGLAGDHEIIGDVRGAGYFMSLELVNDRATRETFSAEECQVLLREFLSPQLQEAGVICRADDRGDPVIQLSPPLICTREHIDEAVRALDSVLPRAQKLMRGE